MLMPTCITIPGLHGSGSDHWQSWAEKEIPDCRRIAGINFDQPVIAAWADVIRNEIRDAVGSVILIAHSFGCLASIVAIADNDSKVAGVILVAPASPELFTATGLASAENSSAINLWNFIPAKPLGVPGVVVASTDDPWMKITHAHYWAESWGLRLLWTGRAGHINVESGFGRWQFLHQLVKTIREQTSAIPLGNLQQQHGRVKNRFSTLVKMRQLTRDTLD